MVWQFPNEPDRIRQPIAIAFADIDLSCQRIHRREQPVLDEHVVTRERLEHARLPGVRVAHQRGGGEIASSLPLIGAMLGDVLEPLLERGDLAADRAAVGFELGFARSPEADTAADTRQVGPHPRQARQQILELRPPDLQLRFVAARARREDVDNDLGAVHHAHAETLLELDALHRREALVEQHQRRAGRGELVLQRFDLALAEIEVGRGGVDALDGATNDLGTGGVREAVELFEVLVDVDGVIGALTGRTHQKCTFNWRLNLNKLSDTAFSFFVYPGPPARGEPNSWDKLPEWHLAIALQLYPTLPKGCIQYHSPGNSIGQFLRLEQ